MLCPPIPSVERRQAIALAQQAWDRIVGHLHIEAEWRAAHEVDDIRWYKHSEQFDGPEPGIQGDLSVVLETMLEGLDESGREFCVRGGDVFEQVETMVGLGCEALDSLVARIRGGEDYTYPKRMNACFRGDGCFATIELLVFPRELPGWGEPHSGLTEADDRTLSPDRKRSEQVGERALARVMAGLQTRWNDETEGDGEGKGTHDLDLVCPATNSVFAEVEITELTSETGRDWRSRERTGEPKLVTGSSKRLQYMWHASLSMGDLDSPQMRDLDESRIERSKVRKKTNEGLVAHLEWTETQMSTAQGAQNLANSATRSLRSALIAARMPSFVAEAADSHGGLRASYDGGASSFSLEGPSRTAELINAEIEKKARKNQALYRPDVPEFQQTQKWLVVYLDYFLTNAPSEIELRLRGLGSWPDFTAQINLRHFKEVWLVWDARSETDRPPYSQQAINTVILTPKESRYVAAV